jgi:hypothetical protein
MSRVSYHRAVHSGFSFMLHVMLVKSKILHSLCCWSKWLSLQQRNFLWSCSVPSAIFSSQLSSTYESLRFEISLLGSGCLCFLFVCLVGILPPMSLNALRHHG